MRGMVKDSVRVLSRGRLLMGAAVLLLCLWGMAGKAEAGRDRPLLVISEVETSPHPVTSGEEFRLRLRLQNAGNQTARRIVVTLQSLEGEETLRGFSPVGRSNTALVENISSGSSREASFDLIASPDKPGGIYNLVIRVEYINYQGISYEASFLIGIIVEPRVSLQLVALDYPSRVVEGETFTLRGELVNTGAMEIKGVGMRAAGNGILEVVSPEIYYGTFHDGDLDLFEFDVETVRAGRGLLSVEVYYTDVLGSRQSQEHTLTVAVEPLPENNRDDNRKDSSGGFWQALGSFFRRLFGLGG